MDFEFSDEQRQLHDAVRGLPRQGVPVRALRAVKRSASGWDPAVWRGLAELGVPAINVPAHARRPWASGRWKRWR